MVNLPLQAKRSLRLSLLTLGLALGSSHPSFGQAPPSASWRISTHPVGISLQKQPQSAFALGLWTQTQQLRGFSLAGLMNDNKQGGAGFMLSGLVNRSLAGSFSGVSIAPLLNAYRGTFHGLQIGFISGARYAHGSVQLGAIAGTSELKGAQLTSFVSLATGRASGLQLSAVNVAGSAQGLMQLGAINTIAGQLRGLQLGVYNYAGAIATPQIGLVNTTDTSQGGIQIGLVNLSHAAGTRQLGLVNILPDTRIQLLLGGGSLTRANLAVRFRRGRAYSQVGLGLGYRSFQGKFSGSISYHRGLILPLSTHLNLLGDLGVAHIEDTPLKIEGEANRRYAFASRLSLEYRISALLGAYITGGYAYSRRYQRPSLDRHRPIFEAGITFN